MTVEQLKTTISNKILEEAIILSIFRVGSSLFCINHNDEDFVVIIENNTKYFVVRDNQMNIDYFITSKREYKSILNFEPNERHARIFLIYELFKPFSTIYGDNSVQLILFENSDKYKRALREDLEVRWFNPNVHWTDDSKYCYKSFWVAIIGLMMIENKSYEITCEMKNIIQKCHDGCLEKLWEQWVKERL